MKSLVVDIEALIAEYGEDLPEIFRIFREETDQSIKELNLAFARGDLQQVKSYAHKVKGSSRILRSKEMEGLARQIESASDTKPIGGLLENLDQSYNALLSFMDEEFGN